MMSRKKLQILLVSAGTLITILASNPINAETRQKPWQSVNMNQAPVTVELPDQERDATIGEVDQSGNVQLTPTYDRLTTDDDYIALQDKTAEQDRKIQEMIDRLDALREKNRHWEAASDLTEISPWVSEGSPIPKGPWTPAITNQTSNFVQTRTAEQKQTRTTTFYDRITYEITGKQDTRVSHEVTDTRYIPASISRNIVAHTTPWVNSGGLHSCSGWSPAASTVEAGKTFYPTRSCSQTQTRNVSYTVAGTGNAVGTPWQDTQTLTGITDHSTGATGTKVLTECGNSYGIDRIETSKGWATGNNLYGNGKPGSYIYWEDAFKAQNGWVLPYTLPTTETEFIHNGYRYHRGKYLYRTNSSGRAPDNSDWKLNETNIYQVCRTKM